MMCLTIRDKFKGFLVSMVPHSKPMKSSTSRFLGQRGLCLDSKELKSYTSTKAKPVGTFSCV